MAYLRRAVGTVTKRTLDSPILTTPALGTPSAGVMTNMTGAVEASLVDDAVTLAKMVAGTDGNIISYDASGNPVAIATGTDGQVLTSTGAGSPPAFEAAAGGGKILQVVSAETSITQVINSSTAANSNLTVDITPAATSSKILILVAFSGLADDGSAGDRLFTGIDRDGTNIFAMACSAETSISYNSAQCSPIYLDSPSTTSAVTYTVYGRGSASGYDWRMNYDWGSEKSTITCIEVGA